MNEEVILSIARSIGTDVERKTFLDDACARDADLRCRIDSRLMDQAGGNQGNPTIAPPGTSGDQNIAPLQGGGQSTIGTSDEKPWPDVARATPEDGPGSVIGRYRLLEKIGEGGFGTVYVAEQKEPIKRRVALKIVKLGMDTRQVVARFEAERQALAMMEHPNIAKVLDAGATQTGRPYFVMELVRGVPVTDYCDLNHVTMESRLKLFIRICNAIQHAHQKGIIHRDIKPSNILVTLHDGAAVPKVIDFGIAKATQGELTDKTLYTQYRQFIGTPTYMSPEQAEMSGLDIDTRSDIYSLGVLLYELLVGNTPFDASELMKQSIDEMRRTIREKNPPRPSSRIMKMSDSELAAAAMRLDAEKSRLVGMLRGDMDWIVMKALEKDRTRRYETANGLAVDVQRHLNNEPVFASPPSRVYRFHKMAQRNRLAFLAAGFVVAALVLGLAATMFEYRQAVHQRDVANRAREDEGKARQIAEDNADRADRAAVTATRISESLQRLIASANPDAGKGANYTVRQMLDDFAAGIGNTLADQPEAEAALQSTIGKAYWRLGVGEQGEEHLARALALRRSVYGFNSNKTADTLVDHAWALDEENKMDEAHAELSEALNIYHANNADPASIIRALEPLVVIYNKQTKWSDLEETVAEALAEAKKTPGVEYPEIANMNTGLEHARVVEGHPDQAEDIARNAIAMHLRLQGPKDIETGWGYYSLWEALIANGKYVEAFSAAQSAMGIWMKVYPSNHWSMSTGWNAMLDALEGAGEDGTLLKIIPNLRELDAVESVYRLMLTANPPQAFGDVLSQTMRRVSDRARLYAVYRALSGEPKAAGREQEAAECQRRAAGLLDSFNQPLAAGHSSAATRPEHLMP